MEVDAEPDAVEALVLVVIEEEGDAEEVELVEAEVLVLEVPCDFVEELALEAEPELDVEVDFEEVIV